MTEVDELARRAVDGVIRLAARATRFASYAFVAVVLIGTTSFLLGLAALDGSVRTVWIVLGLGFGAVAIRNAFVTRWRLGSVGNHVNPIVAELVSLLEFGHPATRTMIDAVEADEREADGSVLAAGSNLGAIYRLGGQVASEGSFESPAYDTKVFSSWGKMSWQEETPSGSSVSLQVRTGNTAEPDSTWSEWSAPYTNRAGSSVDSPSARYVQWKATLKSGGKESPRLGEVDVTYLQRNLPPELKSVDVQAPGTVFQRANRSSSSAATPRRGRPRRARCVRRTASSGARSGRNASSGRRSGRPQRRTTATRPATRPRVDRQPRRSRPSRPNDRGRRSRT
jgi:hypothetical protein